jgi:proteasome accessory factor B
MATSADSPLVRQWILLREISSRRLGLTIKEMARDYGVSQRTIRRDLMTLQRVGFPLEERESDHGRKHWRLGATASAPLLSFTWDEGIALFLARRHLEPLAGTHLWESAQRAFRKIRATLSDQSVRYLEKMAGKFHRTTVGAGDYGKKGEVIDQLMIGIEDRRIAFIAYQSLRSTEPVTYEIYPYGIVFHSNSLYLVAHSVDHGEVRHFKIDRLSSVDLETLKFNKPTDFDLQQHFADSFGIFGGDGKSQQIRIRFSPEVARFVEESHWHDSQNIQKQRDGSLIFEVMLDTTEEIKSWVLSFGRHAEVLQPKRLREEILLELHELLRQYKNPSKLRKRKMK